MKFVDGKILITLDIKNNGKIKTILFNIEKQMPTEIDETQVIKITTIPPASHTIGGYYLEKEKEDFDITDENYINPSASLLNYIKNKDNPTVYVRVEPGCEKLILNINETKYELNINEATLLDETKVADVLTLTGKDYELKQIEKEVKVANNGNIYGIKFVVYKYVLKEITLEDGTTEVVKDLYLEKENQTVQLVKNTTSQNLKLIVKTDKVDVTKLKITTTQKYISDEFQDKVITVGELTKSAEQPDEKVTYYDLPVTTENYGKAIIEANYEDNEKLSTKLTVNNWGRTPVVHFFYLIIIILKEY